jgi:uncharacterized Zn ribbon protein
MIDIYRRLTIDRSINEFKKLNTEQVDTKLIAKIQDAMNMIVQQGDNITLGQVISSLKFYTLLLIDENMTKYDEERLEESKEELK